MKEFLTGMRISLRATLILALICCAIYPLTVWVLAQGLFPDKANGSLIVRNGEAVGSSLLGQVFREPRYFHPRPSAAGSGYDATLSGGSNLGPLAKKLFKQVTGFIAEYRRENGLDPVTAVSADAVTASASGLDPHISLRNACLQAPRVARARGWNREAVFRIITRCTEGRDLGFLGEPRVNVLRLNLAMDRLGK